MLALGQKAEASITKQTTIARTVNVELDTSHRPSHFYLHTYPIVNANQKKVTNTSLMEVIDSIKKPLK